jgi:hypothetical protein
MKQKYKSVDYASLRNVRSAVTHQAERYPVSMLAVLMIVNVFVVSHVNAGTLAYSYTAPPLPLSK